jgi:hypothetical protein
MDSLTQRTSVPHSLGGVYLLLQVFQLLTLSNEQSIVILRGFTVFQAAITSVHTTIFLDQILLSKTKFKRGIHFIRIYTTLIIFILSHQFIDIRRTPMNRY